MATSASCSHTKHGDLSFMLAHQAWRPQLHARTACMATSASCSHSMHGDLSFMLAQHEQIANTANGPLQSCQQSTACVVSLSVHLSFTNKGLDPKPSTLRESSPPAVQKQPMRVSFGASRVVCTYRNLFFKYRLCEDDELGSRESGKISDDALKERVR